MGNLFTWGYNNHGQLGDGTKISRDKPNNITERLNLTADDMIISFHLGLYRTSTITSNSQVYTWGVLELNPTSISFKSANTTLKKSLEFNAVIDFTPTREGFTFSGWYIGIDPYSKINFATMPAKNLILYGHWIPNE